MAQAVLQCVAYVADLAVAGACRLILVAIGHDKIAVAVLQLVRGRAFAAHTGTAVHCAVRGLEHARIGGFAVSAGTLCALSGGAAAPGSAVGHLGVAQVVSQVLLAGTGHARVCLRIALGVTRGYRKVAELVLEDLCGGTLASQAAVALTIGVLCATGDAGAALLCY